MSLHDDIQNLSAQVIERLDASRGYYVHTRQAWRLVQQLARKGHPVGIVDLTTKRALPAEDLESKAHRYANVRLPESVFADLSRVMEDWFIGLIRAWLTAYPEDLDLNFDPATGQRRGRDRKDAEIQIPLSRLLQPRALDAVFAGLIEKVTRDLVYERPDKWFRYLDSRVSLGCPDEAEREKLAEMKAVRDCLEHNRGVINRDYIKKAGRAALYAEGDRVEIKEAYLLERFTLLQQVVENMTVAASRIASGPKPPRPSRRSSRRGSPPPS
jgi:hypothetical protein